MKLIPLVNTDGENAKCDDEDFDYLVSVGPWIYLDGYAARIDENGEYVYMHHDIVNMMQAREEAAENGGLS